MKKIIFTFFSFFLFIFIVNAYTEAPIDITKMSALEISDALDKGYITSEQLVNMYMDRINEYDADFNVINQINSNALDEAKRLDEERKNGKVRSRLHGIPIIVKCNIDVIGMPTTAGAIALKDNMPNNNAFAVQKLVDAGAIIIASANMSEFAYDAGMSYSSYGYVRNAFNLDYSPYGSSGGSGVAVAISMAALSLGTDTNASVRLPAMGASLVGIRPTLGNVSRSGVIPYDVTRDTIGVLSKDVDDSAYALSIITGVDSNDSYTKNASKVSSEIKDSSLNGLRIGVPTQYLRGSSAYSSVMGVTDKDINKMAEEQINKLKDAGAEIIYIDYFVKSSNLTISGNTMHGITMCDSFNEYLKGTTGTIKSFNQLANSSGHVQYLGGLVGGCGGKYSNDATLDKQKQPYKEYVESIFDDQDLDVIVYPTVKMKNGSYKGGFVAFAPGGSLPSVLGYPSITVPMGYIDGLSYGLEFMVLKYQEDLLYRVASGFENISGVDKAYSSIAPSLYSVSDNVIKLNNLYEEALKSNIKKDWINSVKDYYSRYNEIEDKDGEALKLINDYSYVAKIINNKSSKNIFKKVLLLIIILVVLRIIYVRIMNYLIRKRRRKKRRKR